MPGLADRLLWQPKRGSAADWAMLLFLPAVWMVPCTLFIIFVSGVTGLAITPPGWGAAPVMALFVAYSIDRMIRRHRETQAQVVLGYLENAMRLNLPLPAFLAAAEASERGSARASLQRLQRALAAGYPIHAALAEALPYLPEEISRTLAAAEPLGQIDRALARVVRKQPQTLQFDSEERTPFNRFYPIGLALVVITVVSMVMIFVMPKMREILKDFRADPPWITKLVLSINSSLTEGITFVLIAGLLAAAVYWPLSLYLHRIILPGWRLPSVGGLLEFIKWWIPGLRGIERDRAMARTAEFLEETLRAGVPLTTALERSLILPTNVFFRKRLRTWCDLLEKGQPLPDAARRARLPELLAGLLSPGQDQVALADMFGFLARYYRQRFSRALLLLRAATEPALVIFFGIIVFGVALSIIQPIIQVLQQVMRLYPEYM